MIRCGLASLLAVGGASHFEGISVDTNTLASRVSPLQGRNGDTDDIEHAKDRLVTASEPLGKIDVEVCISVRGVLGCNRRKWATPRVQEENDDFAADNSS